MSDGALGTRDGEGADDGTASVQGPGREAISAARPLPWLSSALRVGQHRAREVELALEEPVLDQVGVLLVATERVAVGHVAELPHARPADLSERVVRVEVAWTARRRD